MTGATLTALAILTALNIFTVVKYARLEIAYNELRKVNKILQKRLANSYERPF
jgi:glutamine synthetase adenylyltransferase